MHAWIRRAGEGGALRVPWRALARLGLNWHPGMTAAVLLLVVGAALMFAGPSGSPLHTVGFGIVLLAAVVQLGTRIWMTIRDHRKRR